MATTVQIAVTLDSSGAVTGIKQLGDGLNKIPPPSPKIKQEFDGIESAERRAHIAGQLFVRTTGVEMPRALENVIARSRTLGPLLAGAFNLSIIGAASVAVLAFGAKIVDLGNALVGNTDAVREMGKAAAEAAQEAFWNPKTLSVAIDHLGQLQQRVAALRGVSSFPKGIQSNTDMMLSGDVTKISPEVQAEGELKDIEERRRGFLEDITKLQQEHNSLLDAATSKANEAGKQGLALLDQQKQDFLNSRTMLALKVQDNKSYTEQATLEERLYQGERMALERQSTEQTIALRHSVMEESVQGIARVHMQEQDAIEDIVRKERETLITHADAQSQRVLIHKRAVDQIKLAENELLKQDSDAKLFAEQRANAYLQGSQKIIADAQYEKEIINANLDDVIRKYGVMSIEAFDAWKNAQVKIGAVTAATDQQILIQHQQLRDKTIDLQQQAAIASLPEWQRTEASIRLEHEKTYQELNRLEVQDAANFALYEQQKGAADMLMNDHLRDAHKQLTEQLGGDLQSAFDDMTSGNIGKRIMANMEKFFFQIVAQWILSMNIMKSAFGQLAGIALFGPGSTGAGVFGGGGGPGGGGSILGSLFGGGSGSSTSPSGAAFQSGGIFSDPSTFAGGGLSSAIAGTGATPGSGLLPSASTALTTSTMADALGGIGGVGAGAGSIAGGASKAGGSSSIFSLSGLAALAPLGSMALGAAGGKIGSVGGMLMGLLLTGKLGSLIQPFTLGAGLAGTAAVSALVGAATGGLIGFGIGQNHGGILGSLAGAGSGALAGFMVGGPIGALVGGIVGLLGGIFGGIFGSSKRKKQANALADNTILPDVTQIVTGFDGFQVDNSSAIQQLEQLRTDSQKQLSALKSQGNDVFNNKVNPAIDAAEAHIRDTQGERDRRSAQTFGPPQFEAGGMFNVMSGGNAGVAVLHDGEFVVNARATKNNGDALRRINAGGSAGGFHIAGDFVINAQGPLDRAYVKGRQFRKDVLDMLDQAGKEGELRGGF